VHDSDSRPYKKCAHFAHFPGAVLTAPCQTSLPCTCLSLENRVSPTLNSKVRTAYPVVSFTWLAKPRLQATATLPCRRFHKGEARRDSPACLAPTPKSPRLVINYPAPTSARHVEPCLAPRGRVPTPSVDLPPQRRLAATVVGNRGEDTAYPQRIVATRPLYRLQDRFAQLSRLQRI
jgi:hypothetical protein